MKGKKLTNEDIGTLCLSLAQQLSAGIGFGDALSLMAQDCGDSRDAALLSAMAKEADAGAPLPQVFRSAGIFPAYLCGLLDVGCRVGKLDETLLALWRHYDGREKLEQRLRSAVLYPAVLALVMLAVVVVLLVWVLPVFNDVYALLGSRLTGLAGGLLLLGTALGRAMPVLCVLLVLAAVLLCLVASAPPVRQRLTGLWRRRRADRGICRQINTARFIQALSLGLSSGMTAQEAAALALTLIRDGSAFHKRCAACLAKVEAGEALAAALGETGLLPKAACRLLDAGTRSGRGEAVIETISQRLLEESEAALENTVSRIEPTLVVIASVLVGVILLTVMLPLLHIMTGIG